KIYKLFFIGLLMGEKYYSFDELINMIDGQNQKLCHKLYFDNKQIFESAKGSKVKHHYWEGLKFFINL
ncbi:MAG TPA: hypothetical protein VJB35_06560, partial [Candidatus Nanoarchaeia archaeon]|nr:hypothetical protein [Candidatus Nanoarchaeia archaeon]